MFRSSTARIAIITVAVLVSLGLLRYKSAQRATWSSAPGAAPVAQGARQQLKVGFLPVT